MTAGLRGEPGARFAAGGERDREVGPGLGELGGGLDAGQPLADDQHGAALAQGGQTLAQPQRRGPAGHVEGVLGRTGDIVVGDGAAERVEEGVVPELALPVLTGHRDGPALGVDARDPGQAQPHPGAREHVGERADREVLAGRELVEPHPLDEVGHGVDDGDLDVGGGEPAGQVSGGEGPGVSGAEYDDAVLHGVAPVVLACPLNETARRLLTGGESDARHRAGRVSPRRQTLCGPRRALLRCRRPCERTRRWYP